MIWWKWLQEKIDGVSEPEEIEEDLPLPARRRHAVPDFAGRAERGGGEAASTSDMSGCALAAECAFAEGTGLVEVRRATKSYLPLRSQYFRWRTEKHPARLTILNTPKTYQLSSAIINIEYKGGASFNSSTTW